jgi:hypothetical protein
MVDDDILCACAVRVGVRRAVHFPFAQAGFTFAQISSVASHAQQSCEAPRHGQDANVASGGSLFAAAAGQFCGGCEFFGFRFCFEVVCTYFSGILEEEEIDQQEIAPFSPGTDPESSHAGAHL